LNETADKGGADEMESIAAGHDRALEAVGGLKAADVTELSSFRTAPAAALIVIKSLCILFSVKPNQGGDYWAAAKEHILKPTLLSRC